MCVFRRRIMMKKQLLIPFETVISLDNLLEAWKEFLLGKRQRADVRLFSFNLMDKILTLHQQLANQTYAHGGYEAFNISDPKPRSIHKATVRDRLVHHAIFRQLYPFFQNTFNADSYSCQKYKGTHAALDRFRSFIYTVGQNNTKTCWVLKGDIRKFFASVDQQILLTILASYIPDANTLALLQDIVSSFHTSSVGVGLPLGNLTSQLLVNIYLNEFDQFAKHKLKAKFYIRYCDDFVILSKDKSWLEGLIPLIQDFLWIKLRLELHPQKVSIKTVASGVDFLGWVQFSNHRVLRTVSKRRMINRVENNPTQESIESYMGLLGHGNTQKVTQEVIRAYYLATPESDV